MAFVLTDLSDLPRAGFDTILDARSPAEYAEDHVPGAASFPVLDNEERAKVGTEYVQHSRFGARKTGAALVLRNIAAHLDGPLADKPGGWRPLVYCWRGGQRSGTFGWLLREIGWRAETLDGGYRSYRRLVVRDLYERPFQQPLVVLAGLTCTAKTEILHRLGETGHQVLDLEGMACHRGSIFGGMRDPQPSQKAFESRIASVISAADRSRPLLVEAESSKVGDLLVPPRLWAAMCAAPRVAVSAPLAARAAFFGRAYADLVADPDGFCAGLARLRRLHGGETVARWQDMVRAGETAAVAAALMADHYDPRYTKSEARHGAAPQSTVAFDTLSPEGLAAGLPQVSAAIAAAGRVTA